MTFQRRDIQSKISDVVEVNRNVFWELSEQLSERSSKGECALEATGVPFNSHGNSKASWYSAILNFDKSEETMCVYRAFGVVCKI